MAGIFDWKAKTNISGKNALTVSLSLDGVDGEYGVMCYTEASKSTSLETEEVKNSCNDAYDVVIGQKTEYSYGYTLERDSITHKLLIAAESNPQIYNNVYMKVTDLTVGKADKIMRGTITAIETTMNPHELVKGTLTFVPIETISSTDIVFV